MLTSTQEAGRLICFVCVAHFRTLETFDNTNAVLLKKVKGEKSEEYLKLRLGNEE